MPINRWFGTWLYSDDFPVITLALDSGSVFATQSGFASLKCTTGSTWWMPFSYRTLGNGTTRWVSFDGCKPSKLAPPLILAAEQMTAYSTIMCNRLPFSNLRSPLCNIMQHGIAMQAQPLTGCSFQLLAFLQAWWQAMLPKLRTFWWATLMAWGSITQVIPTRHGRTSCKLQRSLTSQAGPHLAQLQWPCFWLMPMRSQLPVNRALRCLLFWAWRGADLLIFCAFRCLQCLCTASEQLT